MRNTKIAMLMSALIFPGLGQIYKRELKKGIMLILAATLSLGVLLLGGLILLNYEYAAVMPAPVSQEMVAQMTRRVATHPLMLFVTGLLLAVWVYGVVDAGRGTPPAAGEGGA